jgi:hypothetical protein
MSLFNLDDKPQNPIGIKDYWNLFRRFRQTPLHSEIVNKIQQHLNLGNNYIESRQLGSKILKEIERENPSLLSLEPADEIGSLFGMTLWNVLAEDSDNWKFYKKAIDTLEGITGTEYFK